MIKFYQFPPHLVACNKIKLFSRQLSHLPSAACPRVQDTVFKIGPEDIPNAHLLVLRIKEGREGINDLDSDLPAILAHSEVEIWFSDES